MLPTAYVKFDAKMDGIKSAIKFFVSMEKPRMFRVRYEPIGSGYFGGTNKYFQVNLGNKRWEFKLPTVGK